MRAEGQRILIFLHLQVQVQNWAPFVLSIIAYVRNDGFDNTPFHSKLVVMRSMHRQKVPYFRSCTSVRR